MSSSNTSKLIDSPDDRVSLAPADTKESIETNCPTDTQGSVPARPALNKHTIYLNIEGRGTQASVSVHTIQLPSTSSLPRGNKGGSAQNCIGTLISQFNDRKRNFDSQASIPASDEDEKPGTGRSAYAKYLTDTVKSMQAMMDDYNGKKNKEESEISFLPDKMNPRTLSQLRFSSIPPKFLNVWAKNASHDTSAKAEASTPSAIDTSTSE